MKKMTTTRLRSRILGLSIFFSVVIGAIEYSSQGHHQRDLSSYDKGGSFNFRLSLYLSKPDTVNEMKFQLRSFLWNHWRERRLGYLEATFYSVEGVPTNSMIYIEKDVGGRWRAVVETARKQSSMPSENLKLDKPVVSSYDLVERIERSNPTAPAEGVIREVGKRRQGVYQLRLRNTITNQKLIL
jgi:hypothetical protein